MSRLKYIKHPTLGIVIFEGHVGHNDMASLLGPEKPTSAGFVSITDPEAIRVYGKSNSLKLLATASDLERLKRIVVGLGYDRNESE